MQNHGAERPIGRGRLPGPRRADARPRPTRPCRVVCTCEWNQGDLVGEGGSPPPAGPRSDSRQRRVFPAPRSLTRSPDSHAPQLQPLQAGPKCPHASSLKSHTAAPRPKFRSRCLPAQARRRRVLPGKRASGGLPPCGPAGRRPGEASRASPEVGAATAPQQTQLLW